MVTWYHEQLQRRGKSRLIGLMQRKLQWNTMKNNIETYTVSTMQLFTTHLCCDMIMPMTYLKNRAAIQHHKQQGTYESINKEKCLIFLTNT